MPTIQHFAGESPAESTTVLDTNQAKLSLTFVPTAGVHYAILWGALIQNSSAAAQTRTRLIDIVSGAEYAAGGAEPKDTTDYWPVGGVAAFNAVNSDPRTLEIQYNTSVATTTTARIKDAFIIVFPTTSVAYREEPAETSTSSLSYQPKATIVDYVASRTEMHYIFASAVIGHTLAGGRAQVQVLVDGVSKRAIDFRPADINFYDHQTFMFGMMLTAGAQPTIQMQYRSSTASGNAVIRDAWMLVVPASSFDHTHYAENLVEDSESAGAYKDFVTLTATPQPVSHLVIASVTNRQHASTAESAYTRLLGEKSDTIVGESLREPGNASLSLDLGSYWTVLRRSLTAESLTWKLQFKSEVAATASEIQNGAILLLQLGGDQPDMRLWPGAFGEFGFGDGLGVDEYAAPTGLTATMGLGSPVARSDASISPPGFALTTALGTPATTVDAAVVPAGMQLTLGLGTAVLTGSAQVLPEGFGLEIFPGEATVETAIEVTPSGLQIILSLGTPRLQLPLQYADQTGSETVYTDKTAQASTYIDVAPSPDNTYGDVG